MRSFRRSEHSSLSLAAFGIALGISAFFGHSSEAAAAPVGRCEAAFQNIFQKLPTASEIVSPHPDEVHGRAGRAFVMSKVAELLPPGDYDVIVRDRKDGSESADVLSVHYPNLGAEFRLNSELILQTVEKTVGYSRTFSGHVEGQLTQVRLPMGSAVIGSSVFRGKPDLLWGVSRVDTSIGLELTNRKPMVLNFEKRVTYNAAAEAARLLAQPLAFSYSIEIRQRRQPGATP